MGKILDKLTLEQFADHAYYINRELSWLSFNERVLEEAYSERNPLLERMKFLAITSSNLDEFFMVRVANLKDQVKVGFHKPDNKSGLTPKEQLLAIQEKTQVMVKTQYHKLHEEIIPALKQHGIQFICLSELNSDQKSFTERFFREHVFPVLTPMAIDSSHPFPMLSNKTLNLAVQLEKQQLERMNRLFAVVQVPPLLPRFIRLPGGDGEFTFILLEDLIRHYIQMLFPGTDVVSADAFRITRNADLPLNEEEADDLLEEIKEELKKRRTGEAVRLEIEHRMSEDVKEFLKESLEVEEEDIYSIHGPLDLTFLFGFYNIDGFDDLRFPPYFPQPAKILMGEDDIFEAISRRDILLHHPYESFDPVVDFIQEAAEDPNVLAIKQTLYRVSGNSTIVGALAKAAENGKQVFVLVELKARFDEKNNIEWATKLEESGCLVVYGLVGLKTHSKITLVVRQEGDKMKRYVHLSTGNYNDNTAKLYTDLGLFTSNEEIGQDATLFFNHLSGYAETPVFKQLTISPFCMKRRFMELIKNEVEKSTAEEPGHIIAKMNSLTDKHIIEMLFWASQSGVKIDLIVRGICCLRPGIPHVSENIRVISVVGRYLEHSRIFYFKNGGAEQIFLASADWMTRNLEKRVEILFPILEPAFKERIKTILSIFLMDNVNARELKRDGSYQRVKNDLDPFQAQAVFQQMAIQASKEMNGRPSFL
jgi:polyphosphate kinase